LDTRKENWVLHHLNIGDQKIAISNKGDPNGCPIIPPPLSDGGQVEVVTPMTKLDQAEGGQGATRDVSSSGSHAEEVRRPTAIGGGPDLGVLATQLDDPRPPVATPNCPHPCPTTLVLTRQSSSSDGHTEEGHGPAQPRSPRHHGRRTHRRRCGETGEVEHLRG
jgi:hypothetical protein